MGPLDFALAGIKKLLDISHDRHPTHTLGCLSRLAQSWQAVPGFVPVQYTSEAVLDGDEDPGSATDGDEGPGEPGVGPTYGVLNVRSSPLLVPAAFVAVIRKWYSVFSARPTAIDAETGTGAEPDPGRAVHGAVEP
jgi:hypothetical protein